MTAVVPMFTPDEISRAIGAMDKRQLRALEKWLWREVAREGCRLRKQRTRDPNSVAYGGYTLTDPHGQLRRRSSAHSF